MAAKTAKKKPDPEPTTWRVTAENNYTDVSGELEIIDGALVISDDEGVVKGWQPNAWRTVERIEPAPLQEEEES